MNSIYNHLFKLLTKAIQFISMMLIVCLLHIPQISWSQNPDSWKLLLAEELNSSGKVEYLHLVGYQGQFLYTEMKFAHDGDHWVGILSYPDEGLSYNLDGGWVNDELILLEYNSEEEQVGYWKISRDMETYLCSWQNMESSMAFELAMFDQNWNPDFKKDYGQEFLHYGPESVENPFDLYLTRHIDGEYEITLFDNKSKTYLPCSVSCLNNSCNTLDLTIYFGAKKRFFRAEIRYDQIEMRELSERSDAPVYIFNRITSFSTATRTKLANNYYLVIEFPQLADKEASFRVEQFVDDIFRQLSQQLEILTEDKSNDQRLSIFASVWYDIYYWDDELVSGKWIIQKSWNNEVESMSFNYHMDDQHDIDIDRQFDSDFDHRFYLSHYVESEKKELPAYRDLLIRNKLNTANFDYINFNREGLVLSSEFDTIFGPFELTVSYDEIKNYLKKKSELRLLIQERR